MKFGRQVGFIEYGTAGKAGQVVAVVETIALFLSHT